jgi:hypothetical protein
MKEAFVNDGEDRVQDGGAGFEYFVEKSDVASGVYCS